MRRRGAMVVAVASALMALPATSGAASSEHPVAVCPPGHASLSVDRGAREVRHLGPFGIQVNRRGVTVDADGHVLWASAPGSPFVGAGRGSFTAAGAGGFYQVNASFDRCWQAQRVTVLRATGRAVVLSGSLGGDARFVLTFSETSPERLAMTAHVDAPGATTVLLTAASPRGEAVHGFGAMTRWNLKGGVVPVFTREQGVGRGEPGVTQAENAMTPPQGGAYNTTYAVVPQYLTSGNRGFFWSDDRYGVFDLSRRDRIASQLWSTTMHSQILRGSTPAQLIGAYTQYAGRMRPLPHWVDRGAVVGIQGGTTEVRARVAALRQAGVPLAGVWLQDWVGERTTDFGSRLVWNWTLNNAQYPGWSTLVSDLRRQGIRVMTYVNPMFTDTGVPPGETNLFAAAAAHGYLVRTAAGTPYLLPQGGFSAGLVDL